jgi:hypothetical protein
LSATSRLRSGGQECPPLEEKPTAILREVVAPSLLARVLFARRLQTKIKSPFEFAVSSVRALAAPIDLAAGAVPGSSAGDA